MSETPTAGGSARQEYERRKARDEQRTREAWGRFGNLAVRLTPERQSTRAWSAGAEGERRVGAALDAIASGTILVMHDRRVPATRSNIDHLIVNRAGVWVVDAKKYDGRPERRVDGGFLSPRVERLVVRGRDKTRLVDGVRRQVERVRAAVVDIPVSGVLCFVEADWPIFGGDFVIRETIVTWPRDLAKRIRKADDTQRVIDPAAVAARLAKAFPAY